MPEADVTGLGPQEPETQSMFPPWVTEFKVLVPSLAAFQEGH